MKRIATLLAFVFLWGTATDAQQQKADSGVRVRMTGNLYFAPQIWPDVGMDDDQKVGLGLGGMLGLALQIDDMRFGVGPHIGYNLWMANYSNKPNSATQSVNFGMADVGLEMSLVSGDIAIYLGKGISTMEAYMILDNGDKVTYPGLDGEEFGYQTVGVGFRMKKVTLGILHTSYDDAAKDASRVEIRFSIGR